MHLSRYDVSGGLPMVKRMYAWIDRIRFSVVIAVSIFTVSLCLLQVILRYFTFLSLRPFSWGDEVVRLSSLWVIFLGISIGVRENAHFAVDLFLGKIKTPRFRRVVDLVLNLVVVVTLLVVAYQGAMYTITNFTSFLQNIKISMAWFYASIPVGTLLCVMEYGFLMVYGKGYKSVVLGSDTKSKG
jgi:TRAP-type C4-dicarboxylate transport system permease small subunit